MSRHQPPATASPAAQAARDPQDLISARILENPALTSRDALINGKPWVDVTPFCNHVHTYGYAILNQDALGLIHNVTVPHGHKVLSLFTGLGYAEAQMIAQGMDVIGFDREVLKERWLLDTHQGPGEMSLSRFSDRALFLSFPDPTKKENGGSAPVSFIDRFLNAGGSTVITINEARPRAHGIKCDQELLDRLAQGTCVGEISLPAWPTVMCFVGRGHAHNDFQPVLKVHQF
jgi:hypothetical protein